MMLISSRTLIDFLFRQRLFVWSGPVDRCVKFMTPSTSTLACFLKYQSHSLTWLSFLFAAIFSHICFWQVNADIPAIEKAIQASGSKVSSFVFVPFQPSLHHVLLCLSYFNRLSTTFFCVCPCSAVSLQISFVFVLFQLTLYKVPGAQVKMSGEDLKACVLEIQEVLVNWTTSTELLVPGVLQQNALCISL